VSHDRRERFVGNFVTVSRLNTLECRVHTYCETMDAFLGGLVEGSLLRMCCNEDAPLPTGSQSTDRYCWVSPADALVALRVFVRSSMSLRSFVEYALSMIPSITACCG